MSTKRHKPEEIVSKLRQVDVLVGQGKSRADAIRAVSINEQTYCRWRKQYGGMGTDQLKELKRLQKEIEPRRARPIHQSATLPTIPQRSRSGRKRHRSRAGSRFEFTMCLGRTPIVVCVLGSRTTRSQGQRQAGRLSARTIRHGPLDLPL
jgi:putative transposase